MDVHKDFAELCFLLNANRVEYPIVGGYAVAFHGAPRFGPSVRQYLEGVSPLVPQEARYAPEHAEGLERPRSCDAAAIEGFPAKLPDKFRDRAFRGFIVAAEEHGGRALVVMRIDHACVAHAIES